MKLYGKIAIVSGTISSTHLSRFVAHCDAAASQSGGLCAGLGIPCVG